MVICKKNTKVVIWDGEHRKGRIKVDREMVVVC